MKTLTERFHAKVEPEPMSGCWLWLGARCYNNGGYGRLMVEPGWVDMAHRVAYRLYVGPIPVGREIDHLCRNRACVNPRHLQAVTRRTNVLRGISPPARFAKATHCPQGHPYDAANTYLRPDKTGRDCYTCRRVRSRRKPQVVSQQVAA